MEPAEFMAASLITCRCPRCGYDLSGTVASWSGQCPVDGVCSECGLGFGWRDVLSPVFNREARLFEHCATRRLANFRHTLVRSLRPWSFWRWVRMEHDIDLRRAWFVGIMGAGITHAAVSAILMLGILAVLFIIWLAERQWWWYEAQWATIQVAWPLGWADNWGLDAVLSPVGVAIILWPLAVPLGYCFLGETFRRARVRGVHLWRITAYTLPALPLLLGVQTLIITIAWGIDVLGVWLTWWDELTASGWLAVYLGIGLWLLLCWGHATQRYLRLPNPWLVAFVMVFMGGLAASTAYISLIAWGGMMFW